MNIITNGQHIFEVVNEVPEGYHIWNIGQHMTEGYLPLCKLAEQQAFKGGRSIETNSLKAIPTVHAQEILKGAGIISSSNINKLEKYVLKNKDNPARQWEVERIENMIPLLKQIPGYRRLK